MTPVAGGITDTEQDWFVFLSGATQSFIGPRIPIDRIVRMLEKVRTGFLDEAIRQVDTLTF
jgi:hypothetical protein